MAEPPAGHVHSWRQHCEKRYCGWRRCILAGCYAIQSLADGHLIDGPKPPLKKEGSP